MLLGPRSDNLPSYVSLRAAAAFDNLKDVELPVYLGARHAPFVPEGKSVQNLKLASGVISCWVTTSLLRSRT